MKKLIVFSMIAVFAVTGCTGTFKVTKKIYNIHRSQTKWMDEVLFLGFSVFQVYTICMLGDAIIFNSIEFWTGRNPITSNQDSNNTIAMKYDQQNQEIEVKSLMEPGKSLVLSKTDSGVVAKNKQGQVLFTSVEDSLGGLTVLDANKQVMRHYSPQDVQRERIAFYLQYH